MFAAAGVINDALLEQGWKFTTESVESWVSSFVQRRYASTSADLQQAWAILTNQSETSVYNGPRGRYFASWGNTVSGRTIPIRKHERRLTLGAFRQRHMATRRPFWASGAASEFYPGLSSSDGFMGSAPR